MQTFTPHNYQKYCIQRAVSDDKLGLLLDMGLGKTIQIIALLEDAYGSGEQSPSLIICPASLVYNWEHEIRRFAPDLKVMSVVGSGSEREVLLKEVEKNPRIIRPL